MCHTHLQKKGRSDAWPLRLSSVHLAYPGIVSVLLILVCDLKGRWTGGWGQSGRLSSHAHDSLRFVEIPCSFGHITHWWHMLREEHQARQQDGMTLKFIQMEMFKNQKSNLLDGTLVRSKTRNTSGRAENKYKERFCFYFFGSGGSCHPKSELCDYFLDKSRLPKFEIHQPLSCRRTKPQMSITVPNGLHSKTWWCSTFLSG